MEPRYQPVEAQGISRRDLLKKGAALGGTVVWVTPVVQTLGMGRAFASSTSPDPGPDVSYIALVLECDEEKWYVKWEVEEGFESDPGYGEECSRELSTLDAEPNDGEDLRVESLGGNCYLIDWKDPDNPPCENVEVEAAVVKGGQECEKVPGGSLPLTVCLEGEEALEELEEELTEEELTEEPVTEEETDVTEESGEEEPVTEEETEGETQEESGEEEPVTEEETEPAEASGGEEQVTEEETQSETQEESSEGQVTDEGQTQEESGSEEEVPEEETGHGASDNLRERIGEILHGAGD